MKILTSHSPKSIQLFVCLFVLVALLTACTSDKSEPTVEAPAATEVFDNSELTVTASSEPPATSQIANATPLPIPTAIVEEAAEIEESIDESAEGTAAINEAAGEEAESTASDPITDGIETLGAGRQFNLPGDNIFPEGVSYNPANGKFYVGATTDGTLYEGDVNGDGEMTVFSAGGADGRAVAIGTKVDSDGNLWVAGGRTGQMWVYDTADASLVAQFTTPDGETFINDMAITDSGVYFTDSFRPIIWRVSSLESGEAEAWLDLTGSAINYVPGFNLNGIVATPDGKNLIVVHAGEGELYRINTETKEVVWVQTGTIGLTGGDGMAYVDGAVYVMRNSFAELVRIELAADLNSGDGGEVIYSDLFIYPTTIAFTGNTFLVANSQFNNQGGTPQLPFTITQIPLP